jgi:hypothetical protein
VSDPTSNEKPAKTEKAEKTEPTHGKVDHDRLFKELIGTFFMEFMELFFPDEYAEIDPKTPEVEPLDKEVFTDVVSGDKHEVDLLRKVKQKGVEVRVIVHIEAQSSVKDDNFGERMFDYYARLLVTYRHQPILPIVVFSFDTPLRAEKKEYKLQALKRDVLNFKFGVVQLNQLDWHNFLNKPNPIASAMMAKMNVAPEDRVKVKLECLKMLLGLELDDAKNDLVTGFVNTYLRLNKEEKTMFEQEVKELNLEKKENLHLFWTDWHEDGWQDAVRDTALRLLRRKLNELPAELEEKVTKLETPQLSRLTEDLLDFTEITQLEAWLDENSPKES